MAQQQFKVTIARVDGPVYDSDAEALQVPAIDGEMTVLANHEPFISPLKSGTIVVTRADGTQESFEISSGTLEVNYSTASVLIS